MRLSSAPRTSLLLLFVLLALPPLRATEAAAPALDFKASLDRSSAAVGDRVVATYQTLLPKGFRLEVEALVTPAPDDEKTPGPVFDFASPISGEEDGREKDGQVVWTRSVPFTPLAAGDQPVLGPRLLLISPGGEKSPVRPPTLSLKVASRLPADQKPEEIAPRADRPVKIPPLGPWFWGAVVFVAAAVTALVVFLLRRKRKAEVASPIRVPDIPPGPEFLAAIDSLGGRLPADGDDPRPFYSELTHATKRYLERQLNLPVLEWTTLETIRRLREAGWEIPREVSVSELLGAADHVKFGRGTTTHAQAGRHIERARALYEHLERSLAAAAAALAAAAPPIPPRRSEGPS